MARKEMITIDKILDTAFAMSKGRGICQCDSQKGSGESRVLYTAYF